MESTSYTYNICAYKNLYMCAIKIDENKSHELGGIYGKSLEGEKGGRNVVIKLEFKLEFKKIK